jgi:S-adenosylmethionine synthetase
MRVPPPSGLEVEVVERKGLGHPDTISDALAERFSIAFSRFCLDRFDRLLHHNVDKVLLAGGAARPAYGGGEVLAPIEVYLAGRATAQCDGVQIPLADLASQSSRDWLKDHLRALDPVRHVRIHCLTRPGSEVLTALVPEGAAPPLANDTSVGVGFAPETPLERTVRAVEHRLNAPETKLLHPEIGEDIKVMGIRRKHRIQLTVACALIDRHVPHLGAYRHAVERVTALALETALEVSGLEVAVQVNTADRPQAGQVYLTVTGTSAESGDDGQAGRGNRANGLITPYRPMTLEAAAGKNPLNHVGKLYQLAAQRAAHAVVTRLPDILAAECWMVSTIGDPVTRPQLVDVHLQLPAGAGPADFAQPVQEIVAEELARIPGLWREAMGPGLTVY